MEEIIEKINENEEEKVSGGTAVIFESSSDNSFKGTNGEKFGVLCDNCGGAIKGKGGVVSDSKGNNYCLYCAKRKLDLLKKMGINEKFSTVDGLRYTFED